MRLRLTQVDVVVAVVLGLLVWMALAPSQGSDTAPPTCQSRAGWDVACDGPAPLLVALGAVCVVLLVATIVRRPR